MSALKDQTIQEFLDITASSAPAPGGGSVAALAGALGAALAGMVAELTVGREKYRDSEEAMQQVRREAEGLRQELLLAIDKDSESFTQYMEALAMPKNTEEEKAARRAAMQEGLKAASLVPFAVAETAAKLMPLAKTASEFGNPNAVTDALVSAMMARSAVLGAILNCRINLASIKDEGFVAEMNAKADALIAQTVCGEKEIFAGKDLAKGFIG